MSIFSRKNKPNQSQAVGAKPNGHAPPARPNKDASTNGPSDGSPVDPILQRMALQAESRKRMNSQTPDYSIKSASSSPVLPPPSLGSATFSSTARVNPGSSASQDALFARSMTADSTTAPIEPLSPPREPRRLRKSSSNTTSQIMQSPGLRGVDPDTQKVRMPPMEGPQFVPQISRDPGYTSVVPASTMVSRSQPDLNTLPEPDLFRRHRMVDATLPRMEGESSMPTASPTTLPAPLTDVRARTAPSTPTNNEAAGHYVSRLDPGPASSSFLTSSVVPDISRPRSTELDPPYSAPSQPADDDAPITVTPVKNGDYRVESSKRGDEFAKPTPNMSRPRESQPRPVKFEQLTKAVSQNTGRRGSDLSQSRRSDPAKQVAPASPTLSRSMIVQRTKDQENPASRSTATPESRSPALAAAATAMGAALSQSLVAQPASASTTPFVTPRETPAVLAETPKASAELPTWTTPSNPADSTPQTDQLRSSQADVPSTALDADQESPSVPLPSPKPHDEFPYLAGISKGPTVPHVSVLEGFKVNRRGQILDEEGEVIGELTSGQIVHCVRRKVNGQGEVVDDSGKVVGKAVALPRRPEEEEDETPAPNFAGETVASPVSAMTPMATFDSREIASTWSKQTRVSQRANSMIERTLNNSDPAGNVVYIELDASADSQAVPLMDQSDIFIPPYGGSPGQTRSKSVTNLTEIKRIADGRQSTQSPSHTPSASQEKNSLDDRRSSKWSTRHETPSAKLNSTSAAQERSRSFSLMTNNAPKAVLGPTWESLLDTVPDRSQSFAQHKSVIIDGKLASQTSLRAQPPARSDTMPASASNLSLSSAGGKATGSGVGGVARTRRASQATLNARNSTHQTFVKSPLSSIANTPPDTAVGDGSEASFSRQLTASNLDAMQASPAQARAGQPVEEEDENAAPAPTIMKRTTGTTKQKRKRKSIFGIPFGRSKPVPAVT